MEHDAVDAQFVHGAYDFLVKFRSGFFVFCQRGETLSRHTLAVRVAANDRENMHSSFTSHLKQLHAKLCNNNFQTSNVGYICD